MKKTIKTIALITVLFLSQFPFNLMAQTCIEYKNTNSIIRVSLIGRESNIIRYDVTCPIAYIDTIQTLLNIKMNCENGTCTYGSQVSIPNLPELYHTYKIEHSDLGKYLDLGEQAMGANFIMAFKLLPLNEFFTIKNK